MLGGCLLFVALAVTSRLIGEEARDRLRDVPGLILRVALLLQPSIRREDARVECEGELFEILKGADARPITRLFKGVGYSAGLILAWAPVAQIPVRTMALVNVVLSMAAPLPVTVGAFAISSEMTGNWSPEATPVYWLGAGLTYTTCAQLTYVILEDRNTLRALLRPLALMIAVPVGAWGAFIALFGVAAAAIWMVGGGQSFAIVLTMVFLLIVVGILVFKLVRGLDAAGEDVERFGESGSLVTRAD